MKGHRPIGWSKLVPLAQRPNRRFVVTGGPGAGKTTVLNVLAGRGYRVVPDSAREIIRERMLRGLAPRPPLKEFGESILRLDIAHYRETPVADGPVFFERGVLDALCILDQQQAISSVEVAEHVRSFPYNDVVILMPPWEEIYRTDDERDQTFVEAVRIFEVAREWYARWGYDTIELLHTDIDERVNLILQNVAKASGR